jgi:predicted RecB family nuclease
LRQVDESKLHVKIDLLWPGTYRALAKHLAKRPKGYQMIQFDVHGALLTHAQFSQGVDEKRYVVEKRLQTRNVMDYKSAITQITSTLERHHIQHDGDEIRALPRQLEGFLLILMLVRLTARVQFSVKHIKITQLKEYVPNGAMP